MSAPPTCYIDTDGSDIGCSFVTKEYLLDVYPSLIDPAKASALWLWGRNNFEPNAQRGILGDNTIIDRSSPVQTISGGTNWKQVSLGYAHSAAIKTDGTLWLWGGCSSLGVLGNNSAINQSSPVQTVSGGTNWKQVSLGQTTSAAVKTDGTLWLWGCGADGRLGNNAVTNRSSPVQTVSGGTNWKEVALGQSHSAAIKTDGTLWLWGLAQSGRLGTNSITAQSSPVQTVSGGTNWKQVSAGVNFTAAIKTDGTLWIWGDADSGRLGTNSSTDQSSPVQTVSGGTNWKQVSLGTDHSAAIKTDGTLWVWGSNICCALGITGVSSSGSPVQTISGGNNWKQISLTDKRSAAIKTDGTLWMWGTSTYGSLGNEQTRYSFVVVPTQTISEGNNWKQVSINGRQTAAIREEGDW